MSITQCNPECAVCGSQVAPQDQMKINGEIIHYQCEEQFEPQDSNIMDDPRDDEDSYAAFDNPVDPSSDANQ